VELSEQIDIAVDLGVVAPPQLIGAGGLAGGPAAAVDLVEGVDTNFTNFH
jgi:hypothetical protein